MLVRKVIIVGANGRMGRAVAKGILASGEYHLVGAVGRRNGIGEDIGELAGEGPCGIRLSNDLKGELVSKAVDAVIDFSTPDTVMGNIRTCLPMGVPMVVGTTGFPESGFIELNELSKATGTGIVLAPNFSIGAILMMLFSKTAARYFGNIEIVELHNDRKLDSPSGTALKTAQMIQSVRGVGHLKIHSMRLPGHNSIQDVICGDSGQLLTIRHETLSAESYIPGILLALRELPRVNGVVYGLEHLLFANEGVPVGLVV